MTSLPFLANQHGHCDFISILAFYSKDWQLISMTAVFKCLLSTVNKSMLSILYNIVRGSAVRLTIFCLFVCLLMFFGRSLC